MSGLPSDPHEVIRRLHAGTSLTYRQIANALGCSESRVKQIVKQYVPFKQDNGTWSVRKGSE